MKLKKPAEAINDFEKAIELDSENPKIYNGLGMAYHLLGDRDEALDNMNRALDKESTSIEFLMDRATIYLDMRLHSEAYADLDTALTICPDDPLLFYKRGIVLFASMSYDDCIEDLHRSIECNPDESYEPDIYYHIGIAWARKDEFEMSIPPLSKCISMKPNKAVYYHERAKSFQMIGEHQMALNDFNVVIENQPKNAHAHFRRAYSYKCLKMYNEAAEDMFSARQLAPDDSSMIVNAKQMTDISIMIVAQPGEEQV